MTPSLASAGCRYASEAAVEHAVDDRLNADGRVADPAIQQLPAIGAPAQRMKNQSRTMTGIGTPTSHRRIERMKATPVGP